MKICLSTLLLLLLTKVLLVHGTGLTQPDKVVFKGFPDRLAEDNGDRDTNLANDTSQVDAGKLDELKSFQEDKQNSNPDDSQIARRQETLPRSLKFRRNGVGRQSMNEQNKLVRSAEEDSQDVLDSSLERDEDPRGFGKKEKKKKKNKKKKKGGVKKYKKSLKKMKSKKKKSKSKSGRKNKKSKSKSGRKNKKSKSKSVRKNKKYKGKYARKDKKKMKKIKENERPGSFSEVVNSVKDSLIDLNRKSTAEHNTAENNTAEDNAAEDNTAEDNKAEDNKAEDYTAEDNKAEDNTAEDNTAEDNTAEE